MSAVLALLLRHWQAAAITVAVLAALGSVALYLHERDARVRAEVAAEAAQASLDASVESLRVAEIERARSDAAASLAAQETARVRAAAEASAVQAAARVRAASVRASSAIAALDSAGLSPEEAAVIDAQGLIIVALNEELAAQVEITEAADAMVSLWTARYGTLRTSFDAQAVALEAAQAAIAASAAQLDASRPSLVSRAAWAVGLFGAGYLAGNAF